MNGLSSPSNVDFFLYYIILYNNWSERRQCLIKTNLKTDHTNEKR